MNSTTKRRAAFTNTHLLIIIGAVLILSLVAWKMFSHKKKKSGKAGTEQVQKSKKGGKKGGKKKDGKQTGEVKKPESAPAVEKP
ncbi:MAG: hypothetical protein WCK17_18615 [Verrucomicrobiota bacterium]